MFRPVNVLENTPTCQKKFLKASSSYQKHDWDFPIFKELLPSIMSISFSCPSTLPNCAVRNTLACKQTGDINVSIILSNDWPVFCKKQKPKTKKQLAIDYEKSAFPELRIQENLTYHGTDATTISLKRKVEKFAICLGGM